MRVFVDTEFTDLIHPQLLSAGLVADDGAELYLEIDLQTRVGSELKRRSTTFVREHVLPLFRKRPDAIVPQSQVGERIIEWLLQIASGSSECIEIVYDYAADAALLEGVMRGSASWDKLRGLLDWSIVGYLHKHPDAEAAKAASLARSKAEDGLQEHHALADARALREAFRAAHKSSSEAQQAQEDNLASSDASDMALPVATEALQITAVDVQGIEEATAKIVPLLADTADDIGAPEGAPIVFLDVDDVLCLGHAPGAYEALQAVRGIRDDAAEIWAQLFHPHAVEVLREVHDAMGGHLRYVVTSLWRTIFNRSEFAEMLRNTGLSFVADRLERRPRWRTQDMPYETRADEVLEWIRRHGAGAPFVVVDDDFSGAMLAIEARRPGSPLSGRVVICTQKLGLQARHSVAILDALRRPL